MRYGVVLPSEIPGADDPGQLVRLAVHMESLGYDELSVVEHAVVIAGTQSTYPYAPSGRSPLPDDCSLPDPLELLAFIAGRTTRLGLATGVLVLPVHHPIVLAKRLATLDRLSGGRLRACVGLGWMREEIEACGGDFDRRGADADEAIAAMRALWAATSPDGASFTGSRYRFAAAHSWPKPVRTTGVPLYVGGHSLAAARRAGRLGDGFQPLGLGGAELDRALATMRAAAELAGRDPASVEVVLGGTLGRADLARTDAAAARGASRLLLAVSPGAESIDDVLGQLDVCADRLELRP